MSMNVSLPPELEARVRQRVESGMYGSASEVIREALRLFDAYEWAAQHPSSHAVHHFLFARCKWLAGCSGIAPCTRY